MKEVFCLVTSAPGQNELGFTQSPPPQSGQEGQGVQSLGTALMLLLHFQSPRYRVAWSLEMHPLKMCVPSPLQPKSSEVASTAPWSSLPAPLLSGTVLATKRHTLELVIFY